MSRKKNSRKDDKGAKIKPKEQIFHRRSQRPQRGSSNSVFMSFSVFGDHLFFCGLCDLPRGYLDFLSYVCAFASLAAVGKGKDGAKSALREILDSLVVAIKSFRCGYEHAG